jgi:hypothetical protein
MHFFTNPTRRGVLNTAAVLAILLTLAVSLIADDKSPKQIRFPDRLVEPTLSQMQPCSLEMLFNLGCR